MSDNVSITPGSGATISTDECTVEGVVVQVQRVKPTWGGEGTANDVNATTPLPTTPYWYNGATYDPVQDNTIGTLLASAAQTATVATSSQTNTNARGVTISVNVTAVSGTTPTLTPNIQAQGPVSLGWYQLNATATNITASGLYVYQVYPGIVTPGAGSGITQVTPIALPRVWRINFVVGGTTPSFTFSAGYAYTV